MRRGKWGSVTTAGCPDACSSNGDGKGAYLRLLRPSPGTPAGQRARCEAQRNGHGDQPRDEHMRLEGVAAVATGESMHRRRAALIGGPTFDWL